MASQWSEAVVSISAGDLPTVVWDDHQEKCDYPVRIQLPDTLGGKTTIWFDDVATYRRWLVELSRDWYLRFGNVDEMRVRALEPEMADQLRTPMIYGHQPPEAT